ncbi:MAG: vanadium-dependent haloperoxidase [Acidobacteria bacterium]|nr:vanadium-dependent haloperoxidase [Acidobacteriota bacterium]
MTRRVLARKRFCGALIALALGISNARANEITDPGVNPALKWNDVTVFAIKTTSAAPTVASRALYIVHTAIYNAWSVYEPEAVPNLQLTVARQKGTANDKAMAISYAAYRTLLDLFPTQQTMLRERMIDLGYNPGINLTDPSTPAGVGNAAAAAVIELCHKDGSNQLGDFGGSGPYSDYTDYQAVNFPEDLVDPGRWQPLRGPTGAVQRFLSPHWGKVTPFALQSPDQFRPGPPPILGTWLFQQRLKDTIRLNAELDDRTKMSGEYWDDFAGTDTPPGHWNRLAEEVSLRDKHDLDQDVKMFFALNAALHDVSVSVWDAKRAYDYVRPISAIRHFYKGQTIQGWGGPGKGIIAIDGSAWQSWISTPPHPEFPSGHSAYSNAAAEILKRFTGDDTFVKKVVYAAGTSRFDPGTSPEKETTLEWRTFSEVAEDAAWSRRVAGIHFDEADFRSRVLGRAVASLAWEKYTRLLGKTE